MKISQTNAAANATRVVVLSADQGFLGELNAAFGANAQIALTAVPGSLSELEAQLDLAQANVAVIDLDAAQPGEMQALERLMVRVGHWPPMVVITQAFDAGVARALVQMRVSELLVKPVAPVELARTCARVAQAPVTTATEPTEAKIYTFLPAVGGAGVTTLALQSAMLLLNSGPGGRSSTCLVDLDFQHGACADYLDLEPRLNLSEIEPRPERLDRQLMEVMLSHHPSGLAVIAAPNRPADMSSFDPDVVTRLLDMVSTQFDYVVFDMPRTWFSWTDSVLLGSDELFIVSEMTVPGLRHAKQLVEAIRERLGDGPHPKVIVNRFEQQMFSTGLRKNDIERVLGDSFATCIPNHYAIVREAIDRGVPLEDVKPGNKITLALKKFIVPQPDAKTAAEEKGASRFKLSWARS